MPTSPNICRGQISWDYDRAEIIADGVVHALGVCLGLIGAVVIVVIAVKLERIEVAPILVYVIGLVTMLGLSATYNMWPVSPTKWVLRRFDHSAIYLLIAGTSGAVRSSRRRSLPTPRLERCHCLRLVGICPPEQEPMASRHRRHSLFTRRPLSCLAQPALSQRNLAWLCAARG
jgi:hemolysin III